MTIYDQHTLHSLPCKIEYTGAANISKRFEIDNIENVSISYLRGRLLKGEMVKLDSIYGTFIFVFWI